MLDLQPYLNEIKIIEPGQTVRFNHIGCPAGTDTRRRLYVTRPEADATKAVAYCHNCQEGASHTGSKWEPYRNGKHGDTTPDKIIVTDDVEAPPNLVFDTEQWTTDAKCWLINSGLSPYQTRSYDIGLDSDTNRIYLPRYQTILLESNNNIGLNGYQLRKIEDRRGPKYLTVLSTSSIDPSYTGIFTVTQSACLKAVLVEDLVSGIHIAEACKSEDILVIINYGVKVNLQALDEMRGYDKGYIWLDNDSEHIKHQAEVQSRTLQMLTNGDVEVITDYSDPKHYSYQEIREVLYG